MRRKQPIVSSEEQLEMMHNFSRISFTGNFYYRIGFNQLSTIEVKQLKLFKIDNGTATKWAQYLDSGGQRVKKLIRTSASNTETTVYIAAVFERRYDSSANAQSVVHVGGIATVRSGYAFDSMPTVTYQLSNNLGSVNFRLSSTRSVVDREDHYLFGDSSVRTWNKKRYRYCGKEKDSESGLYYYGARHYAPWTCRFISVDPLAADYPYLTPYNYSGNKPITHKDIDGLQSTGDQKVENGGGGTNIIGPTPASEEYKKGEKAANKTTENIDINQIYPDGNLPQPGDKPTDFKPCNDTI